MVVSLAIGIALAVYAYDRVTDPLPAQQKAQEEAVVAGAREILRNYVAPGSSTLEFVDPVNKDRDVGKVYIYPTGTGWEVSGHYRRDNKKSWHPWLMSVDSSMKLESLSVKDSNAGLVATAAIDPKFSAVP